MAPNMAGMPWYHTMWSQQLLCKYLDVLVKRGRVWMHWTAGCSAAAAPIGFTVRPAAGAGLKDVPYCTLARFHNCIFPHHMI
jgi:hypothetical protein